MQELCQQLSTVFTRMGAWAPSTDRKICKSHDGARFSNPQILDSQMTSGFVRGECRADILSRHPRDVRDRDFLGAHRFAFAFVRAAAETFRVRLVDHVDDAACSL